MFIIIKADQGQGYCGIDTSQIKGFFYEAESEQIHLWMGESDSIVLPGSIAKPLATFLTNNVTNFYEVRNETLQPITRDKLSS